MAKRRRLEAPTAAEMNQIEEEFRRETSPPPRAAAPIAQVAAETAGELSFGDPATRAEQARDKADATRLRDAEEQGLILLDVPLDQVKPDAMIRDRSMLEQDELTELQLSIAANGVRLPIEIFALEEQADGAPAYGLLSGYRRYMAVQNLRALHGSGPYDSIRAILRQPKADADRFAAMVEENEVRASLSHYERGRIAVIAAQQGAFENTEGAVNAMFPVASKAKRSKIRSFALIFEELGDLLVFPERIKEKEGLRLSAALRAGGEDRLREVLATGQGTDPESEWALLEAVLPEFENGPKVTARGGRPKLKVPKPGWHGNDTLQLSNGITLRKESDSSGYVIRIAGSAVDAELMDSLIEEIRRLLEAP
ncbi:ParB N-terminal domain-containing protein [Tateyamaria sp. syn59]|uniref:ParB N-terminal domain-containing protein n=1 Tax=Tateyamaria sp. syn59 TaxID=2576942 RepID=UPI0011BE032B|nr:ParB N-terminal domain-containing protein [Tateyamaria sp. syn59]